MSGEMQLEFLPWQELEYAGVRDIRAGTVDQIKERIEEDGYDPSNAMRVVVDEGEYVVADGNHRLKALSELAENGGVDVREVPCVLERDADIVAVTVESNKNESTFAEQDLFDYLDYIDRLQDEHTQAEIGEKLGWSRSKVSQYTTLLENVATQVLEITRSHQQGRVAEDATNVANFTEGWFRNSGIYDLDPEWQLELIEWFCEERSCKPSQNQVGKKADELKEKQEQLAILDDELNPGVAESERNSLAESITKGEHTDNSLRDAIEKANNQAKNQAHFGHDAVEKLRDVPENKIDCVVMDPPYGTDYTSHRDTENPEFGANKDDTLALLNDVFEQLTRVCKANAHIYMFFSMNRYCEITSLASEYFEVTKTPLVWAKNNHAPTRDAESGFDKMYAHQYEPILVCRMPNGKERELNGGVATNVLEHDVPKGEDRWHDSQKPISLCEELITNSTGAKATVLDPFAGSGTTLLAAEKTDRHYIGIEADERYESRFKREVRQYE